MYLCAYLKIEFMNISMLISLRISEGESANSPVLSSPHSPIIDIKYVFIF